MNENGDSPKGDLRASMLAAVEPIRANLVELNREIADTEADLAEKRKLRSEAERVLKALDPEFESGRTKPNRVGTNARVAAHKVEAVGVWLRDTFTPADDLTVPGLRDRPDRPNLIKRQALTFALDLLADQGQLRLDRLERIGSAGRESKVYRLIPAD